MMTVKQVLLISVLILSFSCEKEEPNDPEPSEPTMPPLTHQGLNTFGCYIDGELFVANEGPSVWSIPPLSGSFNESTRDLGLQATRYIYSNSEVCDNVKIRADILSAEGEYEFRFNEDGSVGYGSWTEDICDYYYNDILDPGKLTITHLDEENNIIAGTFYINLYNEYCESGDTIMNITDGRFDFRY